MMPGEFFFGIRSALCRHCGGVFQRSNGNTYFCRLRPARPYAGRG